jgi:selenide, water dikinase
VASVKRLVLVGGGHTHLLVLDRFAYHPPPDAEIVLVSPNHLTAYSGMVPGLIAGDHDYRSCHIDVAKPAARAGARFVRDRVSGIDPVKRMLFLEAGPSVEYDLLSLDVGATSALSSRQLDDGTLLVPVRPVDRFLLDIQQLWLRTKRGELSRVAIVGGGAAGVELALALHYRMNHAGGGAVGVALVSETRQLLPERGSAVSVAVERLCRSRGLALVLGAAASPHAAGVTLAGHARLDAQAVVWATGADPLPWLATTGLAIDERGFIAVDECLRSLSHPEVFAAGDCASIRGARLPKSGALAVRQGSALAANLRHALAGEPLEPHKTSAHALAILNCGGRHAFAVWRSLALQGRSVWHWKNRLDRRFMRRFS